MKARSSRWIGLADSRAVGDRGLAGLRLARARDRIRSEPGKSLNGTSAFAAIFKQRGHEVRPAIRLTEELAEWAEGIVRFATYPGPPEADEAKWYREWLADDPTRWLIYVVRDFDTQAEYWKEVRDGIAETARPDRRAEAEEKRAEAADWVARLPKKPEKTASPSDWFKVETASTPPKVCTKLEGAWAEDVDAAAAALTVHESVHSEHGRILLSGDDPSRSCSTTP